MPKAESQILLARKFRADANEASTAEYAKKMLTAAEDLEAQVCAECTLECAKLLSGDCPRTCPRLAA